MRCRKVFFQKYFSQKHEKDTAKATKVDKRKPKRDHSDNEAESDADEVREDVDDDADDDSEEEEENSDAEEAEIWKVRGTDLQLLPQHSPMHLLGYEGVHARSDGRE